MKRLLPLVFAALTIALIVVGTVHGSKTAPSSTPEGAKQSTFGNAKAHDWKAAYSYIAPGSDVDMNSLQRDLQGRNWSLRTYSQLEFITICALLESSNESLLR